MSIRISNYQNHKNIFYVVKNGETLENIAKKFGVSKKYIQKNNIEDVYMGLIIFLPEINFKSYVVQPFDTLSKIAEKLNVTIEDIKIKNGLESDYVFVGQKLYI